MEMYIGIEFYFDYNPDIDGTNVYYGKTLVGTLPISFFDILEYEQEDLKKAFDNAGISYQREDYANMERFIYEDEEPDFE